MVRFRKEVPEVPDGEYDDEDLGMDEDDLEEEEVKKISAKPKVKIPSKVKKPAKEEVVKQRYSAFRNVERIGIMDTESKEIIAEGEFALLQSMALVLDKLELIESNIGGLIEQ